MSAAPLVSGRAVAIVIIAVLGFGFWFYQWTNDQVSRSYTEELNFYEPLPTDMNTIAVLEGNAAMKFPPSAREIYGYVTGLRDVDTLIRFSMKADELAGFLQTTLC